MFPQRPRPGESEEDLLEAQNNFHGRKRSKFAQSRAKDVVSAEAKLSGSKPIAPLLQSRVLERNVEGLVVSPPSLSNEPFPIPLKLPQKSLETRGEKGKSIFAQTVLRKDLKHPGESPVPPTSFIEPDQRHFGQSSTLLGDSNVFDKKVLQDIHEENVAKLSSMSEEDILLEQKRILESLDPKIMEFLKVKSSKYVNQLTHPCPTDVKSNKKKDDEVDHLETEKRKWMKDISVEEVSSNPVGLQARFDFKGDIMEGSKDDDFDSGLHHHGEEPHRAGYTLDELLTLARSTFPQQKVLALETLGSVIRNYKRGIFDGIFEVNILESLLRTGILEILRMGMDEKNENIIFPAAKALSEFLYNELDELSLDLIFNHYNCDIQPSLPTEVSKIGSKSRAEYEDEKKELKDAEVIQLDVVYALLRMDILDRIAYIISVLNPGVGVTLACLKILLRIVRHSQGSARAVLHHPTLLKEITKSFLPSLLKSYSASSSDSPGSPIHLALKLIRVLMSWDKNYALSVTASHKNIGESLLSYIAFDPTSQSPSEGPKIPSHEGLTLVLEAFRFWQILLRYQLGTEYYLDFYPILLRQLLYYESKVDILDSSPNKKYVYDHGSGLIQVLNATVLNLGYSNHLDWSQFREMFSLLETCVKKWSVQIVSLDWTNTQPSSKVAIVNLLAAAMRALANFYWKFSEQNNCCMIELLDKHVRKYCSQVLAPFFNSEFFASLLTSSIKSSSLNLTSDIQIESGKNRDPKNLPSFGSVVYRGSVVPSIGEGSPYNLLVSTLYSLLLCKELDKSLSAPSSLESAVSSYEGPLIQVLQKSMRSITLLNSNWFTRIEAYYWTLLSLVIAKFQIQCSCLRSLGNLALLFLHSWDEELALELLKSVIFNGDLMNSECFTSQKLRNLKLEDSHCAVKEMESLYMKHLFPSKSCVERSKTVFSSGSIQNLTVTNSGELLLPWDWKFLPLLTIHNSRTSTDASSSEEEIREVQMCLEWIVNMEDDVVYRDPYPSVTFTRLCTVFMATPDLFLDSRIKESCKILFQRLITVWKGLDLSKDIPGSDNFFTFYGELLKQFSAVSYGDDLFAEFVTLPLAMKFESKYRFAFWSDHSDDLRVIQLASHSLSMKEFLHPVEEDLQILRVYFTSLLEGRISKARNPFLYTIALHHIRSASMEESFVQDFKSKLSPDLPLFQEMFL